MNPHCRVLVGSLVLLTVQLFRTPALANDRVGLISGTVTTLGNAPLADVKIIITTKTDPGFRRVLATGSRGTYSVFLEDARPLYRFRFEKAGFATFETDRKVPIYTNLEHDIDSPPRLPQSLLNVRMAPDRK
ncbi:carboxypeptidase regulatory-like domain-containing protein [bacterium]|nr:carboxypeptidase regulatory-like domain-containing protein [bacterium]